MTPKQLEQLLTAEVSKVGQGRAFKNKWIAKEGDGLVKLVSITFLLLSCAYCVQASSVDDVTQKDMREVDSTGTLKAGEKALADLRKRKLIVQK